MSAALFAVVSPLQYINALEAIAAFGLEPSQCYLALGESKKLPATTRQVRSLLDESKWKAVHPVSGVPAPRGRNRAHSELLSLSGARSYAASANALIAQARRECGEIQYLFLGDYRPLNFRHFFAAVPEAEPWLLDDGSITHQVIRFRKDKNSPHLFTKPFAQPNLLNLSARLGGLRYADPPSLGYFTCYDVNAPLRDHVRHHGYEYFQSQYGPFEVLDEVWFLGANHVENKFCSSARYFSVLNRAQQFYGGMKVVYLPHRGEDTKKLVRVAELGFEVRNHDLPIEIVVGQTGKFPKILAGIASSAIDNLSVILKDRLQVHLFCVSKGYAPPDRWKHLSDVIDYHRRDVFGVSSLIYEGEEGRLLGPVQDHRYSTRSLGLPRSECGGYFYAPNGRLQGYFACTLTRGLRPLELRVVLSETSDVTVVSVGETVRLTGQGGGDSFQAVVCEVLRGGEYNLRTEHPLASDEVENAAWQLEVLGVRREHRADRSGIAGVLLEPAASNLLLHARDLELGSWLFEGVHSFLDGSQTNTRMMRGPDGTFGTAFIKTDHTGGEHQLVQVVRDGSKGVPLTLSWFLRFGGCSQVELSIQHLESGQQITAQFSLDAPRQVGSAVVGDCGFQEACVENWWRCAVTGSVPAGDIKLSLRLGRAGAYQYEADGCSGLYLWGPQLEANSTPTSFLPSRSQPMTRHDESAEFAFPSQQLAIVLELSLPNPAAPIYLLRFSFGLTLLLNSREGELVLNSLAPPHQYKSLSLAQPFTVPHRPFVMAVARCGTSITVVLDGQLCFEGVECPDGPFSLLVEGGPLHLRRSYVHHGTYSSAELCAVCTVAGLSQVDRG